MALMSQVSKSRRTVAPNLSTDMTKELHDNLSTVYLKFSLLTGLMAKTAELALVIMRFI